MDDLVLVMLVRRSPHWQEEEDQGDQGEREQSTGQSILGRGGDWGEDELRGWGPGEGKREMMAIVGGQEGRREERRVPAGHLCLSSGL